MPGVRTTRWTTTWTTTWTASITALAAGLLLTGCGGGGETATAEQPAESSTSEAPAQPAAPALATADSDLGEIVVDADGRTVYVFDEDEPGSGKSVCTDECADTWPALTVEDEAPTADGVDGELGTIEREDGTLQATLDGRPLYLFAGDGAAGDVTGQGVDGTWFVLGGDGEKITEGGDDSGYSY